MTTSIVSYLSEFGKSVMMSLAIDFHRWSGIWFDWSIPYGACQITFLGRHISQFLTYRLIVSRIFGQ